MTAEVIRAMEASGVRQAARRYAALTVGVTAARRLLSADDLAAISETKTSPVLRVEPLPPAAA